VGCRRVKELAPHHAGYAMDAEGNDRGFKNFHPSVALPKRP
jgi:hypothetical protein